MSKALQRRIRGGRMNKYTHDKIQAIKEELAEGIATGNEGQRALLKIAYQSLDALLLFDEVEE